MLKWLEVCKIVICMKDYIIKLFNNNKKQNKNKNHNNNLKFKQNKNI